MELWTVNCMKSKPDTSATQIRKILQSNIYLWLTFWIQKVYQKVEWKYIFHLLKIWKYYPSCPDVFSPLVTVPRQSDARISFFRATPHLWRQSLSRWYFPSFNDDELLLYQAEALYNMCKFEHSFALFSKVTLQLPAKLWIVKISSRVQNFIPKQRR